MDQFLYHYKPVDPTTWVYLSSLLTIAIYFKFSRVWSVRNLDLIGLIALAPGLLMVQQGGTAGQLGYAWLFATGGFFLVRLLIDPMMVRRPLLEPNLSPGGLTFAAVSLCVFLMVNAMTREITDSDLDGPRRLDEMLSNTETQEEADASLATHGPAYPWMHLLASIPTKTLVVKKSADTVAPEQLRELEYSATARVMAILSHLAVVLGMVLIGARHFGSARTGVAAAVLYLLLPYTAQMTGRVEHVLPAALVVWAVFAYRRPLIAGTLLGLGDGGDLLPDLSVALMGRLLLASGVAAILGRLFGDARARDGHAVLCRGRAGTVIRAGPAGVRLGEPIARGQ